MTLNCSPRPSSQFSSYNDPLHGDCRKLQIPFICYSMIILISSSLLIWKDKDKSWYLYKKNLVPKNRVWHRSFLTKGEYSIIIVWHVNQVDKTLLHKAETKNSNTIEIFLIFTPPELNLRGNKPRSMTTLNMQKIF